MNNNNINNYNNNNNNKFILYPLSIIYYPL